MIERYISVKQERIIQPIAYVENTNMIPIVLHITDYELPEGAIARAYAGINSVSTVLCEIRENDIIIPVVSGFFNAGKNILQIRVVQGEENLLISFPIPVNVKKDITIADAEEPIQHPGMMDQLIVKYGEMQKEFQESEGKISDAVLKANLAEEKAEDIQEQVGVLSELKADIKTSLVNAFNWLADKIGTLDSNLAKKQDKITLTGNRALISNATGAIAESNITSTQIEYLSGLSSNVQEQINRKATSGSAASFSSVHATQQVFSSGSNLILRPGLEQQSVYATGNSMQVTNLATNAYAPVNASAFNVTSSKLAKENIKPMSSDEAKKILDINVVDFDYKDFVGGKSGNHGVIAEEVLDIIPYCVTVPPGYSDEIFDPKKGVKNKMLSVDYSKFVPYLIRMVQIQNQLISEIKEQISCCLIDKEDGL